MYDTIILNQIRNTPSILKKADVPSFNLKIWKFKLGFKKSLLFLIIFNFIYVWRNYFELKSNPKFAFNFEKRLLYLHLTSKWEIYNLTLKIITVPDNIQLYFCITQIFWLEIKTKIHLQFWKKTHVPSFNLKMRKLQLGSKNDNIYFYPTQLFLNEISSIYI